MQSKLTALWPKVTLLMTLKQKIWGASLSKGALLVTMVGLGGAVGLLRSKSAFSKMDGVELPEVADTEQIVRAASQMDMAMDANLDAAEQGETAQLGANKASIDGGLEQVDRCLTRLKDMLQRETAQAAPGSVEADDALERSRTYRIHQQQRHFMASRLEGTERFHPIASIESSRSSTYTEG